MSLLTLASTANDLSIWSLITKASLIVQLVMIVLAAMSVIGWYIIGSKYVQVRAASQQSDAFLEAFWGSQDIEEIYTVAQELSQSPLAHMFVAGYSELSKLQGRGERQTELDLESVERALMKTQLKQSLLLESRTPFLATTGSAAPFIGLFGTVWGIMNSFRAISALKSASVQTVAPGMAEALIATAIGLIAAIPAVMAFNYFVRRIRVLSLEMETFSKDFLNIVRRNFLS